MLSASPCGIFLPTSRQYDRTGSKGKKSGVRTRSIGNCPQWGHRQLGRFTLTSCSGDGCQDRKRCRISSTFTSEKRTELSVRYSKFYCKQQPLMHVSLAHRSTFPRYAVTKWTCVPSKHELVIDDCSKTEVLTLSLPDRFIMLLRNPVFPGFSSVLAPSQAVFLHF